MDPQTWEFDSKMGGDDANATRLIIEGVEATPSNEDIKTTKGATIWCVKVRGIARELHVLGPLPHNSPNVGILCLSVPSILDVKNHETQVMGCIICFICFNFLYLNKKHAK